MYHSPMPRKPRTVRPRTLIAVELRRGSRAQPHNRKRRTRGAVRSRAIRDSCA